MQAERSRARVAPVSRVDGLGRAYSKFPNSPAAVALALAAATSTSTTTTTSSSAASIPRASVVAGGGRSRGGGSSRGAESDSRSRRRRPRTAPGGAVLAEEEFGRRRSAGQCVRPFMQTRCALPVVCCTVWRVQLAAYTGCWMYISM